MEGKPINSAIKFPCQLPDSCCCACRLSLFMWSYFSDLVFAFATTIHIECIVYVVILTCQLGRLDWEFTLKPGYSYF